MLNLLTVTTTSSVSPLYNGLEIQDCFLTVFFTVLLCAWDRTVESADAAVVQGPGGGSQRDHVWGQPPRVPQWDRREFMTTARV